MMTMRDDEEQDEETFDPEPPLTDFHGNKRELLRRGLEKGVLTWDEIRGALPEEHMSEEELEVFLFTCKNMGISISGGPQ